MDPSLDEKKHYPVTHRLSNVHESKLEQIKVTGNDLKHAFRKLQPTLGKGLIEIITNQLEIMYLIVMNGNNNTYSLSEVKNALVKVLGEDSGYMILDSVVEQLELGDILE